MAVKIRLRRMGANRRAFYRIVATDSRAKRDGNVIEELGYYDPIAKGTQVKLDNEKVNKWLDRGAQPTDTARTILKQAGILKARFDAKAGQKQTKPAKKATKKVAKAEPKKEVKKETKTATKKVTKKAPAKKTTEKSGK